MQVGILVLLMLLSTMTSVSVTASSNPNSSNTVQIEGYPEINMNGHSDFVIYREGWRSNRIELALYNTTTNQPIVLRSSSLGFDDTSLYNDDEKYYVDAGSNSWVKFETGYMRVSNHCNEIIASSRNVVDSNGNVLIKGYFEGANSPTIQTPPSDAVEFNGHFYKAFFQTVTWKRAKSLCEEMGGHLATVTSKEDDDFVYGLIESKGVVCWLGGTDEALEGEWKWITGEEWSYYPAEYGFDNRSGKQHYLATGLNGKNFWDDQSNEQGFLCNSEGYICEWEGWSIQAQSSIRRYSSLSNERFSVFQKNKNDEDIAISGATISYNNTDYRTDTSGNALLPSVNSGSVTVSKAGYITRTLTAEQLAVSKTIYLEPTNDNAPVVIAVWVDNIDVLRNSYPLSMTSTDTTTIKAEVDWGNYNYGSIRLWQNSKSEVFNGDTLSMVISSKFNTSETIKLIATDSDNHSVEKNILIENSTVSSTLKNLDGASFAFGDSISVKLPESVPLIGGKQLSAGISSLVPVTICAENGKVHVAIGVDLAEKTYSESTALNKATGTKAHLIKKTERFIQNVKETGILNSKHAPIIDTGGAATSLNKLKHIKQQYKDVLNRPRGNFGVDADFTIIGFAEGTYDSNGKFEWIDAGVILNPSVSVSKDFQFALGPVPMYGEIGFSADILGQLNIRLNEQAKKFMPNGEISGTISLNGGIGAGIKKVLYAGGGLEGQAKPKWKIYKDSPDYLSVTLGLKAYAKAGIAFFEAKKSWNLAETTFESSTNKGISPVGALLGDYDYDYYDYSNYQIKDLSYLESNSSKTKAGEAVGANAGDSVESTQLKNNIYRESTPQLVVFDDGTKLAVWTDSESSDINGVCLYYSVFNGSSWSAPAKVYNDGTMDYAPQMVKTNGKAYLVWQNATKAFDIDENLSLETIAKDFDISVAVFDGQAFTTTTLQNENLDMQPVVCTDGDNAYIAWINNSNNDWFGNNSDNSILASSYENNAWSQPEIVYSGLNSIDNLAIDYDNGIKLAYCVDSDGDITTTDDLRVYENGVLVSGEENSACSPQYSQHKLYWYSDNSILSQDIDAPENGVVTSDRYQLVNANGNLAAVFTEENGLYSKVSVSYFNTETGTWGTPKTLADNESAIGAFSADTGADGNIEVLINNCAVVGDYDDEEPYGTSSLLLFEDSDYCDISISEPLYDEESFCVNEPMIFDFDLTNNGSNIINGVDVAITDENGNTLSSTYIEDMIVPGETLATSAYYVPDDRYTSQTVTVTATPHNSTDGDLSNNSQTVTLSYENLSVENLTSAEMENGNVVISADIVNWGYQDSDSVTIKLIKDNLDGQVIETKTINGINSLDMQTVSFEVNDNTRRNYFVCIEGEVDSFIADNSDYILIHRENMIGDVNLDGYININDVTAIQRHLCELETLDEKGLELADTNADGVIDIADATHLQMYLAEYDVKLG